MTTASANDSHGSALFVGDEGIFRFKIIDVRQGAVLTTAIEPPYREYWFVGGLVERTAQGPASREADRQGAAPAAVVSEPTPGTVATMEPPIEQTATTPGDPLSLREQAIAHVMAKGRTREVAEKIVEEWGTKVILEGRDEEAAEAAKAAAAGAPATNENAAGSA